jgi:hypothetical protein
MNLYYIAIGLDYEKYSLTQNEIRFEFQQRTNFISDYFSKAVRKLKYKTDGTFKMLSIACSEYEIKPCYIVPFDVLKIEVPFDNSRYNITKQSDDCSYYLELLEQGFRKASEYKSVPLEDLLNLIVEFNAGGCKNQWLHKSRKFKKADLEVILTCEFTTNFFELIVTINQISTNTELVKGVIIRAKAGVSIHEGMYKDIIIEKDIIITDSADSPRIIIDKASVFEGNLNYKINGSVEVREMLSYAMPDL